MIYTTVMLALIASASAFMAPVAPRSMLSISMQHGGKGFGGGEATRDPEPTYVDPNDPKGKQQAIHAAESFSEYLAKRGGGGGAAPAAAAPAPAAAAASIPSGGSIDGAAYDDIWGIDWKIAVYNAWDPES